MSQPPGGPRRGGPPPWGPPGGPGQGRPNPAQPAPPGQGPDPPPSWPPASRPRGIDQGDLPAPEPDEDDDDAPRRGNAALLVIGLLLGILVIGGIVAGLLYWRGTFTTYIMDGDRIEEGVSQILRDEENGFGITDLGAVRCPDDQEVIVKATFTCTATIGGKDRRVPVDILNEDGDYRVNQPR